MKPLGDGGSPSSPSFHGGHHGSRTPELQSRIAISAQARTQQHLVRIWHLSQLRSRDGEGGRLPSAALPDRRTSRRLAVDPDPPAPSLNPQNRPRRSAADAAFAARQIPRSIVMADRVSASITIGDALAAGLLPDLLAAIPNEGLSTDWKDRKRRGKGTSGAD